jgi:hypothetical protein
MQDKETSIEIADYDMGHFPETQEESTEIGMRIVAKQTLAVKRLIAGAFQDVFHVNWDESFVEDCQRVTQDDKEIIMYKNRPFIELGEMEEDFVTKGGTQHMVIKQCYKVL